MISAMWRRAPTLGLSHAYNGRTLLVGVEMRGVPMSAAAEMNKCSSGAGRQSMSMSSPTRLLHALGLIFGVQRGKLA